MQLRNPSIVARTTSINKQVSSQTWHIVYFLLIILYDIRSTTSAVIAISNAVEAGNVNAPEVGAFETEEDGAVVVLVEVGGFDDGMGEVKLVPLTYVGATGAS